MITAERDSDFVLAHCQGFHGLHWPCDLCSGQWPAGMGPLSWARQN